MKKLNLLLLAAALLLLLLFVFPLWKITLIAPQYKDGISMYIWINNITGESPGTLQNINILNHYIGMQYIVPGEIPEFRIFPLVVIGMMILGVLFSFFRNKRLALYWSILLIILGSLGIYDFYLWEYDYGHNLDPKAPIKIPGMVYQPPLLGSKMLLNFKAISTPHLGALALGAAIALGLISYLLQKKEQKEHIGAKKLAFAAITLLFLASCNTGPEPIDFGSDGCSFCKMTIMDQRYGAELITSKGKIHKFDAVECMINHLNSELHPINQPQLLVIDFSDPGKLIDAKNAHYLRSSELPSPMGMYITAISASHLQKLKVNRPGAEIYTWEELLHQFGSLNSLNSSF